jgi:hypothetical protein
MKFLLLIQIAFGILGALLLLFLNTRIVAVSYLAGTGLSLLNLVSLVLVWPRILAKKQVALSIGVIVFKFAILGWIIYEVATANWVRLEWFAIGLSTVVPTVVITSLWTTQNKAEVGN